MIRAYWLQVKAFYRTMWLQLFATDRDLDGPLRDFIMSKGFVWQMGDAHMWLLRSVWTVVRNTFQVLFCYVAMALICLLLLCAPAMIIAVFPFFAYNRLRRLKREAARL